MGLKLIFFDIGSTSAFAHNVNEEIAYGQLDFNAASGRPDRIFRSYNAFDTCLRGMVVDCVVYERPFARGQHATRSLWGQAGCLEAAAHGRGFPVLDVSPSEIKKFATGKGSASKDEMTAAAGSILAGLGQVLVAPPREHEADAICGLFYALANVSKPEPKKRKLK